MNDEYYMRKAIEVAHKARERGNHPFGAILVGLGGDVLLEAENGVASREVFLRGMRNVVVEGPILEGEAKKAHEGFWQHG